MAVQRCKEPSSELRSPRAAPCRAVYCIVRQRPTDGHNRNDCQIDSKLWETCRACVHVRAAPCSKTARRPCWKRGSRPYLPSRAKLLYLLTFWRQVLCFCFFKLHPSSFSKQIPLSPSSDWLFSKQNLIYRRRQSRFQPGPHAAFCKRATGKTDKLTSKPAMVARSSLPLLSHMRRCSFAKVRRRRVIK